MQVDRASIFQHSVHLQKALRHVTCIREHLALRDNHFKSSYDLRYGVSAVVFYVSDAYCRCSVPDPHIVKCFDFRLDGESASFEDSVILGIGIERWIKTNQVNTVIGEISHDVEAIAVIESVRDKSDIHVKYLSLRSVYILLVVINIAAK